MEELSANYWNKRYVNSQNGWDLGAISLPIKEYIDQLTDTSISILIPGCGNGYEGEYLIEKGFQNVYLLDFAEEPLLNFKNNNPNFPAENLINEDFFEHQGSYDLIIEQTLFCAIDPKLRMNYAKKISELLNPEDMASKIFEALKNNDEEKIQLAYNNSLKFTDKMFYESISKCL